MAFSQSTLTEREFYFSTLPHFEPPPYEVFQHTPAASPPTAPAFPGALTSPEQAEVNAWKASSTHTPTLTGSIAWVAAYVTYTKALKAYKYADHNARIMEHRWAMADSAVLTKPTQATSTSPTATGSTPPPNYIPPQGIQP